VPILRSQVQLISKEIELLKVVVPDLQCWGSAVMNIPGPISIMDTLKDNHSMQKLRARSLVNCSMVQYKMKHSDGH